MIGCTWQHLYDWLKFTIPNGYTMDDVGQNLHIDHVIPLYLFDDPEHSFQWFNLQLLTKEDNLKKGSKISQYHIDLQIMRLAIIFLLFNIKNECDESIME